MTINKNICNLLLSMINSKIVRESDEFCEGVA